MTATSGNNGNIFLWLLFVIIVFVCLMGMVGCKCPCAAVPSGGSHDHTGDSTHIEYVHDSITVDRWHKEYVKGDTTYIHDSIFKDRWHNRYVHDSIYINNTDTIYNTVTVTEKGNMFLRNSGIALWVLIGLFVVAAIIGIILKFAK